MNHDDLRNYSHTEVGELRAQVATLENRIVDLALEKDALAKERDAAWSINPSVSETLLREQLAASQAREKVLREAINASLDTVAHAENARNILVNVLTLPNDTSALDARLAEERARCAKVCESQSDLEYATGKVDYNERAWCDHLAAAIRSLK